MTPPIPRRTLAATVTVEGMGLFTDRPARCDIRPADPGSGIVFIHNRAEIPATITHLSPSPIPAFHQSPARHTCLALGDARVITCEHALSAMVGLGITDARIELGDSGELPIGDGSASIFIEALARAGTRASDAVIQPITLRHPITLTAGSATLTATPADAPSYTYNYTPKPGSPLAAQSASWLGDPRSYAAAIAPARTFSFEREANQARAAGLFTRFTPQDLLVLGDATGQPIENTLRFPDEPARHKLLDLIGDLALAGRPIHAAITATGSGHALNHELARRIST